MRDRAVIEVLARTARTRGAEHIPASVESLRALIDHPRVVWDDSGSAVRVIERRIEINFETKAGGVVPRVLLAGHRVTASSSDTYALLENPDSSSIVFAPLTAPLQRLLRAFESTSGVLPPESYSEIAPWLASMREQVELVVPSALSGVELPAPDKLLLRLHALPSEGCEIAICVRAFPLSPLWFPGEGNEVTHGMLKGKPVYCRRDLEKERALESKVLEALELSNDEHPVGLSIENKHWHVVTSDEAALRVIEHIARLTDWVDIEWSEHDRRIRNVGRVRVSDLYIKVKAIGSVFTIDGSAAFDETEVSFRRLLTAAIEGRRFVRLDGRDHVELEQELIERLRDAQYAINMSERELKLIVAGSKTLVDALGPRIVAADEATVAWLERMRQSSTDAPELDATTAARLRPYQREGVRWLLQCSRWTTGACLADEMGLGKTIQAITVLQERSTLGPALVVAPTSLASNWLAELSRFAPDLNVILYRGGQRRRLVEQLGPNTVLVTSYGIVLRDRDYLAQHTFATQVIDEAQMLRNSRTDSAIALKAIPGAFRIALTGTPIENRLGDLWSLFELIAPGVLGTWPTFRALVGVPVEQEGNEARAARLRSLIGPLLLRRTKAEVAADLPPRIEVVQRIQLSPAEHTLYRTAVKRARLALRRLKAEQDQHATVAEREPNRAIQLLAELTRLRQLACHAGLVIRDSRIESSKLNALLCLLDDILPQGNRVLIFSTFTALLVLVREALQRRGIEALYLDGSTPASARGSLVDRFQAGERSVFLISLKAGGTGLNLTAANYVVHLDLWWNPAAQDQASDRAHRIGQTRPVTIVKLVAEDTIEERTLELQAHKRWIANAVLDADSTASLDYELLEKLLT